MIFQWEDFSSSICLYSTLEHKKNVKKYIPWGLVFHVWVLTHTNNTHTHLEVEAMPHRHVLFYPHLSAHWDSHSQPFLTPHTILSTNYPVINHTQRNASLAGCDVFTWTPTVAVCSSTLTFLSLLLLKKLTPPSRVWWHTVLTRRIRGVVFLEFKIMIVSLEKVWSVKQRRLSVGSCAVCFTALLWEVEIFELIWIYKLFYTFWREFFNHNKQIFLTNS